MTHSLHIVDTRACISRVGKWDTKGVWLVGKEKAERKFPLELSCCRVFVVRWAVLQLIGTRIAFAAITIKATCPS